MQEMEERMGGILLRLPFVAKQCGHKSPIGTLVDYMRPEDPSTKLAVEFLRDFVTLSTQDIIAKWYGNDICPTEIVDE
jgi:hypothetical protein